MRVKTLSPGTVHGVTARRPGKVAPGGLRGRFSIILIILSGGTRTHHQKPPENFKEGSVRYAPVRHAPVRRYKPPEGSTEVRGSAERRRSFICQEKTVSRSETVLGAPAAEARKKWSREAKVL